MSEGLWGCKMPRHWRSARLKHICRAVGGGTPDKSNANYWSGDIPWVSPKDMKSPVIEDTEDRISEEGLRNSAAQMVPPRAVLMVMRSGILRHAIPVALNKVPVALNQDMRAFLPDDRIMPEYLVRLIEGHQAQLLREWSKVGATVESLESELVGNTLIPLPSRAEQELIVGYVTREAARIDALIAAKERLLDLLSEKRKAIVSFAVTRGLLPNAPLRSTGVEWNPQAPTHWKALRVGQLFRQSKRLGFSDLTVLSVYREFGVIERTSRDDNANRVPDDLEKYQLVEVGDLVVNKMKAWQGSLGISKYRGITSPDYVVFRPTHHEEPEFIHFLLRTQLLTTVYLSMSNGIRINQWRIEPDRFCGLMVFLPPVMEQREIIQYIVRDTSRLDQIAHATEQTIGLLKERRTALIAAAITGQINVGVPA